MTMTGDRGAVREKIRPLAILVEKANALVRAIAQPSFVQFVTRIALAVPFWRPGVLKWTRLSPIELTPRV